MLDSPEGVCAGQAGLEYPATSVLFSMTQVMKTDTGQTSPSKQRKEAPLPQIVRVQRPTHGVGKDQVVLLPAGPTMPVTCGNRRRGS